MLAEWPSAVIRYKKQLGNKNIETRRPSIVTREEVFRYTNSVQDWESQVDKIAYVERSKVPGLIVYIDWKNGLKSVHHSTEVYAKCPQKMIEFFEKYTKFTEILADD
ncbi:uncharacterized protein B0P05DRAFT_537942 [Gilbertella persicaria]|nr:uncharacterized protein B0P05DRAFT_537942 [Gilbertella persicaria]KAI8082666.1 hypothetical protein B0P05DRAFT_537942 [Gilbertella persicaria]